MIRAGIDASSSCTGISIFDDLDLIYYDKVKPTNDIGFRENTCQIINKIISIIDKYKVEEIYMEDVPEYTRNKNILKPMIVLGCVQGIFFYEIEYKRNIKINYISVDYWRQILGFLEGDKDRNSQKDKAVKFVNNNFNLDLYYVKGKKSVKDDDDIAESICIIWSQIDPNLSNTRERILRERELKKQKKKNKISKTKQSLG